LLRQPRKKLQILSLLFSSQRRHRINASGAACWEETREEGRTGKRQTCADERQWIGYAPAPPVTLQMVSASVRKGSHVDLTMLREGRRLFVHRCIECHTLPPLWRYGTEDWPEIVNSMSHRASLKPAEREAVIASPTFWRCDWPNADRLRDN
jgi:hypothetical protein